MVRSKHEYRISSASSRLCVRSLLCISLCLCVRLASADTIITVNAGNVKNHITPLMTGSCIEDVNHEIYGGLYAQQIFGESFEEPPPNLSPVVGWTSFGGAWNLDTGTLKVGADAGAKLVNDSVMIEDGVVMCDLKLNDNKGSNAAILVRVSDPHTGADNWNGYEIAISARDKNVSINRHHHDWHLLKVVPAQIAAGTWVRMRVKMTGPTLGVYLNDAKTPSVEYTDTEDPLLNGLIGLRTWNSDASFRRLTVFWNDDRSIDLPFRAMERPASGVSGMWDPIRTGLDSQRFAWDSVNPSNSAHSQRIEIKGAGAGASTAGVSNRGLNRWGIGVRRGQKFTCSLYLRQKDLIGRSVTVALQSADGSRTYSAIQISGIGTDWKRYQTALTSKADDPNARFAIWIDHPGAVWVDQVTLMPTGDDLFHGLPIRADIANGLIREGVKFLRYGGSMVNAPTYKFKNMIGPPDKRPQVKGTWYDYSTNGFGIEEFVRFCREARIEPAVAINIDETAQDAADMVEYLNGSADSVWGKKRAENGHPTPYGVRYIEIGNEEAIDGNKDWYRRYLARFEELEPAMHAKDPKLQLVIAAWWRPDQPLCKEIAQQLNGKAALWDVHVGGDGLHDGEDVNRELTLTQTRLQEWSPGTKMKAAIFEENGGRHDLQRALGHAHILNVTERLGDFIQMDCPANCLQPWLQNDNGWDQGQLFFTPDKVWGMPPYYAQQMAAENYQPLRIESSVEPASRDLDITATRSADGRTLVLKVVNLGETTNKASVSINGFRSTAHLAKCWTLAGELTAVNSPTEPQKIRPVTGEIRIAEGKFEHLFGPHSYTVIRLNKGAIPNSR